MRCRSADASGIKEEALHYDLTALWTRNNAATDGTDIGVRFDQFVAASTLGNNAYPIAPPSTAPLLLQGGVLIQGTGTLLRGAP